MKGTREKIQSKALELFNENGIEYVGMRELAAELGMRIGNITYYFPTKDDLVFAIAKEYSDTNTLLYEGSPANTLYEFLTRSKKIFENGVQYRCLMLSMVHVMDQNAMVAENYKKIGQMRSGGLLQVMRTLKAGKYIDIEDDDVEWALVAMNSLIGRFWFSEAALTVKRNKLHTQINNYLKLQAQLFKPYATKKGLKDIERFWEEEGLSS